jgi:hypothetical protein
LTASFLLNKVSKSGIVRYTDAPFNKENNTVKSIDKDICFLYGFKYRNKRE